MFDRSCTNFLAIDQPFLSKLLQVFVVELVSDGNMGVVPPIVARLVTANQQDDGPPRIERIQRANWMSTVLRPEFPHMTVP
jgi:hypothetical protein